jgi:penicillin-binding protein 1C
MTRKPRGFLMRQGINILLLLLSTGCITVGVISLWFANLDMPDLSTFQDRQVSQSTKIYDRTGKIVLYDIHEDAKRTLVPLSAISPFVQKATIAIEDAEFYDHIGIKPTSIIRAILANIVSGGYAQGGSTITQQVIKNTVLTKDKTITRKLKEWILAIKIEKVLTKDKILEVYLNETPYGGTMYGVEEASRQFFGKSATDLTLAEASYIAALPQAPSFYSPYGPNTAKLQQRQKLVLQKMLEKKFIDQSAYDAALKEKVVFRERSQQTIRAPHFVMYVRDYLINTYGEDKVLHGGLRVTTTLDFALQEKAETVARSFGPRLERDFNASNTAMVAIDPKTGDILAMVGSRDYFDQQHEGNFNVTLAKRQPGSAIKSFVYAAAWQKGYTPDTMLFDVKTEFSSECNPDGTPKKPDANCYSPQDYDEVFEGPMTMKRALAQSRNIPAVKTYYLAGVRNTLNLLRDVGITSLTDIDRLGLTLVLGGGEVSLLELTSGYSVFANDGVRNEYRSVLSVQDAEGNILEQKPPHPEQVVDSNIARQVNDALSDEKVRLDSLNSLITPLGRQVAIKTGTTNDYRDVWVVGYSPNLVIGAWAGKNDNSAMQRKVAGLIIAPVWAGYMSAFLDTFPNEHFRRPTETPSDLKPVLRGEWTGGRSYTIDTISGKLATEYTPPETRSETIQNSVHSILYWVNKDDPRGPIPEHPEKDSQFENWEYGVRNWFDEWKKQHPNFTENNTFIIPTASDDVHTINTIPTVTLSHISTERNMSRLNVDIAIKSVNPIVKMDYFINGQFLGSTSNPPSTLTIDLTKGAALKKTNDVRVVVTDSMYNHGEKSATFEGK